MRGVLTAKVMQCSHTAATLFTGNMHRHMHRCTRMHTEKRQHGYAHYPVVAVDFGHRSVQRLCCFEAVVDVNATEGISKLLRINGTTTVLPAESMHTSHRHTENPKKTKTKNLPKDKAGSPHHSANPLSRIRQSSGFSTARLKWIRINPVFV